MAVGWFLETMISKQNRILLNIIEHIFCLIVSFGFQLVNEEETFVAAVSSLASFGFVINTDQ